MFTDYLGRHPIVGAAENKTENSKSGQLEAEAEEDFARYQTHGPFDFIQTNGSIKKLTKRNNPRQKIDKSQNGTHEREQNKNVHSLEALKSSNGVI